jgi:hypothetical protein
VEGRTWEEMKQESGEEVRLESRSELGSESESDPESESEYESEPDSKPRYKLSARSGETLQDQALAPCLPQPKRLHQAGLHLRQHHLHSHFQWQQHQLMDGIQVC